MVGSSSPLGPSRGNISFHRGITVLKAGRQTALDLIQRELGNTISDPRLEKITYAREVDESSLGTQQTFNIVDAGNNRCELLVSKQSGIIQRVRNELNQNQKYEENNHYVATETNHSATLTEEENRVSEILHSTTDILDRAFHRRTTVISWLLLGYFKKAGFNEDDFLPARNKIRDPEFIKRYVQYLKQKDIDPSGAIELLKSNIDDGVDEQRLARALFHTTNLFGKTNLRFAKFFPIAFTIQNLLMPVISELFPKGFFKNILNTIVVLNPWITEYAEALGNFFIETNDIHRKLGHATLEEKEVVTQDAHMLSKNPNEEEIKFLDFSNEELKLHSITLRAHEAFTRLFGKGNTISSMALNAILKGKYKTDYRTFADPYINDPEFIKKFAEFLRSDSTDKPNIRINAKGKEEEIFDPSSRDYFIANLIKHGTGVVSAIDIDKFKKHTNAFGIMYNISNLGIPPLSLLFPEGFISKVLKTLKIIVPWIGDLIVDPTLNFRKEAVDVKNQLKDEQIKKLFPTFDIQENRDTLVEKAKSFWYAAKNIGSIQDIAA